MDIKNLTKEEILALSKKDRKELLAEKTAQTKFTDSLAFRVTTSPKEVLSKKADEPNKASEKDTLDVTIVCNTSWFCDSQLDVLTSESYNNSIAEKGASIPHIADHKKSSVAHVGDVTKVYTKELSLKSLGMVEDGSTTALVMESTVRKDYNEEVYKFYKNGKINQHSIGLQYKNIRLAVNSENEEDKVEFAIWKEAYSSIINKELVDKTGYFWLVKEIDIIENSCVLFGANSLTPTLEVKSDIKATNTKSNLTTVGTTMNLEEALAKNAELTSKVAALEAEKQTSSKAGSASEQTRIVAILEASKTLEMDSNLAMKQIKSGASAETALVLFEAVKEAVQKATHVDVTEATSTISDTTVGIAGEEKSFLQSFDAALDTIDKQEKSDNAGWGNI